jgi:NAD(P)H-dependent flavin oxidoreductase YrpB (nitropropane dioxygenase family)
MMAHRLQELLDIRVPVIQGAIGYVTCPELAAAVTNAGGLGTLALTGRGPQGVRDRIAATRALTAGTIAANFILAYDVEAEIDAALEAGAPVISLFWGDAAPFAPRIRAAGARLLVSVGSVAEAEAAAYAGADAIVAQGWEAGGHVRGTISTLALVPAVADAIAPVPVIAAGGIADGRGLAAVLALGAQAAWIGTAFLAATEAHIAPHYRNRILDAQASDTWIGPLYDGGWPDAPGRTLVNTTLRAWRAAGEPEPGQRPGEGEIIARSEVGDEVSRYDAVAANADYSGDIEAMPLWAGQGVGLVRSSEPAAAILRRLVTEAEAALSRVTLSANNRAPGGAP